jgi:cytochrome b
MMTEATTNDAPGMKAGPAGKVRVWDPLIRVFHWGLVAAFATVWLTADELQYVHEFAGYTVAGLVAFRLVWGLVGSRYARFARFLKGPGETLAYLGDMTRGRERRYLGHNPAGAAMVMALLVKLSGTVTSGNTAHVARSRDR